MLATSLCVRSHRICKFLYFSTHRKKSVKTQSTMVKYKQHRRLIFYGKKKKRTNERGEENKEDTWKFRRNRDRSTAGLRRDSRSKFKEKLGQSSWRTGDHVSRQAGLSRHSQSAPISFRSIPAD